jgi:hypothetical protein
MTPWRIKLSSGVERIRSLPNQIRKFDRSILVMGIGIIVIFALMLAAVTKLVSDAVIGPALGASLTVIGVSLARFFENKRMIACQDYDTDKAQKERQLSARRAIYQRALVKHIAVVAHTIACRSGEFRSKAQLFPGNFGDMLEELAKEPNSGCVQIQ